jgi:hypothetical protein
MIDISYGAATCLLEAMEEAAGVKASEPSTLPRLRTWAKNFKDVAVIKESVPVGL